MCKLIAQHGHELAVVDDLSTGHRQAARYGQFIQGSIDDDVLMQDVFRRFMPDGVIHFAAKSLVAESVANPELYYFSNVISSLSFLKHIRKAGCPIVFSSTAAIFGAPQSPAINEGHPKQPLNTYGRTKLLIEEALADYWSAYGLPSVSLRYFNAAGADKDGELGEAHEPETHLIPRIIESVLSGGAPMQIFGDDYDTIDGTCIRDYVYVGDLCSAHLLALRFLFAHRGAHTFNLGNGSGFSVKQVLAATEEVSGRKIPFELVARRPGDPVSLVSDSSAARECLDWKPEMPDLKQIIETAWKWHNNRRY
jgi:UDP-glucose 4-epimerase